jgi:PAS domain S-box-containing protein
VNACLLTPLTMSGAMAPELQTGTVMQAWDSSRTLSMPADADSNGRVTEERLRQNEERFRMLVDSITDYAIFLLSTDGVVLTWNPGAQRIKGYAPHEIIGQSFERFYPPEDRAAGLPARMLAAARADGRVEQEGWRVRKDGSRFWADVVLAALTDDRGQLVGFAKVTRDLTARLEAEEERAIQRATERAAERVGRLQAATAAMAAATRPDDVVRALAEAAMAALEATGCVVLVPADDGTSPEMAYVRNVDDAQVFGAVAAHPVARAWNTCEPVFTESWAAVPLLAGQRLVAVLGLRLSGPRSLQTEERSFLLALAEVGAQAIDRAAAYERERSARAEAEAAVRAQEEFLSIASHELRTPLSAVKAGAQLARRTLERGGPAQGLIDKYLEGITRAADRLSRLVDDLLEVSRLRAGQLQLRLETLDMRPLVQEIVERYHLTQPSRHFQLELHHEPVLVRADPLRIEQVLDNVLSNAVKYSPVGAEIRVELKPEADGFRLRVTDAGIGVPLGHADRIFEPFGRAPNATAKQIPGLGLGLAICRQLLEAHGGHIWATSPGEQQGTTITIWLPSAAR